MGERTHGLIFWLLGWPCRPWRQQTTRGRRQDGHGARAECGAGRRQAARAPLAARPSCDPEAPTATVVVGPIPCHKPCSKGAPIAPKERALKCPFHSLFCL